jgi:reactive intermediate/imine deaminase
MGKQPGGKRKTGRTFINLGDSLAHLPFSDGVLVGGTLYISGRVGLDPETGKPPADSQKEARLMLEGVQAVLQKAEMTMDNLVYVQVFCPDIALYEGFNSVYRNFFAQDFPARAFLGSGPLVFGCRFEIQAIAQRE